jgi:DNA excision repair protein ERCC-2
LNDPLSKPVYTVQVRELIEFVLRKGDLGGERQFVGSDRALAGIRGHQKIQRSRPAGYQAEVPVEHNVEDVEFILKIRGRIDGLFAANEETWLEEIKTIHGPWNQACDSLHWAQAKFYGFIHAQQHGRKEITIQLTYLELETGRIKEFQQKFSFIELSVFFREVSAIYIQWLQTWFVWVRTRNQSIQALPFPFAYRAGQRELAVASYRTFATGGRLFLSAPTGIGKTVSVLFPAVKALGEGKLARIFYLTARTVGRTIAEKACADLRQAGLKLRSVTLTAREKVCIREGKPCDLLICPLAVGYYDRVKPALREALGREEMNRATLAVVAEKHQVCPFELSLDASLWSDAVICDYNYVFDPKVYLRRHFPEDGGDYAFLVDEAHNLVDRAREMFSADLDSRQILEVRDAIRRAIPRCARKLTALNSEMRRLAAFIAKPEPMVEASDPATELNLFPPPTPEKIDFPVTFNTSRELPEPLLAVLEEALAESETWLAGNEPSLFREALLRLYFQMHSFRRTAEFYDERYTTVMENGQSPKVRLFCLDPSFLLRLAMARGKATIFFSATLAPLNFHRTMLGGSPDDPVLQLNSPFPSENLAVLIQDRIPTHFKSRSVSLGEVTEMIGTFVRCRRGNYLAYFSSYQYLTSVLQTFKSNFPAIPVLAQQPRMTETERDEFLAAFSVESGETLVGFAVLGGIFGEGIDLMGERLIGAVIVGVGLPQMSVERDLIRDYFDRQNADGFGCAYTFPGMNRVLQAVGRVIRSESDRGAVLLIDSRFNETRYRRLFPAWWKYTRVRTSSALRDFLGRFWASYGPG